MGTAAFACPSLAALCSSPGVHVLAVVTQPDRPKGRDRLVQPSAVKQLAMDKGLPVLQPERARQPEFVAELARRCPDLIVVVAYGQLLPATVLELPRLGCVNVHASLLPRYRGAAPIQWALLNGESETGVTIMQMDAGLDTGPILAQRATPIRPEDTAETLHDRLAQMGAELLVETLPGLVSGTVQPRPQPAEGVSYAPKIQKDDGRIDWQLPARLIANRLRAFTPWPGAFTPLPARPQPRRLLLWQAQVVPQCGPPGAILQADKAGLVVACGQDALRIVTLQLEGGRRMTAQEFLAGHTLRPGDKLG